MILSKEEIESRRLDPEKLELAVQLVKANGFVVFEGVLSHLVPRLHEEFARIFAEHTSRNPPNRGSRRYQMHLPFREPFCDPDVITNPFALPVIEAILGEDCICHYFASDTPLPGSEYQKVHSDIHPLYPGNAFSVPAYGLVQNVNLVDFTEENGPLEYWPGGTHLIPRDLDMEALSREMHSEKLIVPAGSVLLRDMRMWHRGTPNHSDHIRPNMAMIFARHWLRTTYPRLCIPQDTYDGLSARARRLIRFENIGAELIQP